MCKLYVDGLLQAETIDDERLTPSAGSNEPGSATTALPDSSCGPPTTVSLVRVPRRPAMPRTTDRRSAEPVGAASDGWVLGLDEDGNPVWAAARPEVTVNGDAAAATRAHRGRRGAAAGRPDEIDPVLRWMMDQPFTWNGPDFQVPPRKWTTIPFTEPLMERQSNVTGGSTNLVRAGMVRRPFGRLGRPGHPEGDHDPARHAVLRRRLLLDAGLPEARGPGGRAGNVRALRIFETTHQKPCCSGIVPQSTPVSAAAPQRVPRRHRARSRDGRGMFAPGDIDASGSHGNIMFVPNSGYGRFYLSGFDWLPRVAGVATLKKGMRLVPQVWHEASSTLTMSCSGVWPYRPHFVVHTPGLRPGAALV